MSGRVLLVVDLPGLILDRLARDWRAHWSAVEHDVAYSEVTHPYALRRQAERRGLLFWVDQLAFARSPNTSAVPQVVMVHHLTPTEVSPMLTRLQHADAIATISRRWQARLRTLTGRDVWLVPHTIDTDRFAPSPARGRLRADLGVAEPEYVIGFSARAKSDAFGRKGIPLFLEVLAAAGARWPNVVVLLIGAGWESLRPRIEATGCRSIHRVPRTTEDTASLYPAMDVFLCTSSEEGGPCTILEAMACGVPPVTTDVGHVPETIDDGRHGFIARERTAGPFVAAIERLRADPGLRARIGAAARARIVAERSHERVLPGVDYPGIYAEAARTFAARSAGSRAWSRLRRVPLAARYGVRRSIDAVRG